MFSLYIIVLSIITLPGSLAVFRDRRQFTRLYGYCTSNLLHYLYTGKGLSPKNNYCSFTYFQVNDNRCMIITGPNMGGKSSYIKQVSINSVLFSSFPF